MTTPARIFRRSDGLVVHLLVPGYQPGRKTRTLADVQSLCGSSAWQHRNGGPVEVQPPLPAHLRWCAKCIGVEAERVGSLDRIAAELVGGGA